MRIRDWGDGEMGRLRDGGMGRLRDGGMGSTSTSLTVSYVELLSNLWGDGELAVINLIT